MITFTAAQLFIPMAAVFSIFITAIILIDIDRNKWKDRYRQSILAHDKHIAKVRVFVDNMKENEDAAVEEMFKALDRLKRSKIDNRRKTAIIRQFIKYGYVERTEDRQDDGRRGKNGFGLFVVDEAADIPDNAFETGSDTILFQDGKHQPFDVETMNDIGKIPTGKYSVSGVDFSGLTRAAPSPEELHRQFEDMLASAEKRVGKNGEPYMVDPSIRENKYETVIPGTIENPTELLEDMKGHFDCLFCHKEKAKFVVYDHRLPLPICESCLKTMSTDTQEKTRASATETAPGPTEYDKKTLGKDFVKAFEDEHKKRAAIKFSQNNEAIINTSCSKCGSIPNPMQGGGWMGNELYCGHCFDEAFNHNQIERFIKNHPSTAKMCGDCGKMTEPYVAKDVYSESGKYEYCSECYRKYA